MWNGIVTQENLGCFLNNKNKKLNIQLPYDLAIALLDIKPKEIKIYIHTKTCIMFIAV